MKKAMLKRYLYFGLKAFTMLGALLPVSLPAQDSLKTDTLHRAWIKDLPELFITATRSQRDPGEIPARLTSISQATIEVQPVLTTDALLDMVPGANLERSQGIFSKNAA